MQVGFVSENSWLTLISASADYFVTHKTYQCQSTVFTHETYLHQQTILSVSKPISISQWFFTHKTYLHQPNVLLLKEPIS